MKKKFAIVLSGCGVYDGAEIHEAVMTMYAIAKNDAIYSIFAPDIEQHHVIDHITGNVQPEKRNVLTESARIARGDIKPLSEYNTDEFDAIIFPGGFGAAKNLSTLAFNGSDCVINKDVINCVKSTHKKNKPIGALCIAPAIIAKIIDKATVTIGNDAGTIQAIEAMGGTHIITDHAEVTIDKKNKIYTTPCYMLDASITDIADGADNIVKAMLKNM